MQAKFNVWLEEGDKVVLSPWRVKLLETIDRTGSISAAAVELDVPYRRAWEKVQEIESGLGVAVLDTAVGGAGGGGAHLTEAGRREIAKFKLFSEGLEQQISERFQAYFGDQSPDQSPDA